MARIIEIEEGRSYSSYFWFGSVKVPSKDKIYDKDVVELPEVFSIEEGNVECFLYYFLLKYFDNELVYNKNRYDDANGYEEDFVHWLTFNFYTYNTLKAMIEDILYCVNLLKTDYHNEYLHPLKESFSIYYMCGKNDKDYGNNSKEAIQRNIDVVIDFYERFVKRLLQMMENNTDAELIYIMGP